MRQVLCIDIGGPLFDHFAPDDCADPSEVPDAFDAIAILAHRYGDARHAVLKCSSEIELRTRAWLMAHAFTSRTGVSESQIHFCRRDETKLRLVQDLHVTHVVDNSLSDLLCMKSVGKRILLNGLPHEVRRHFFSLRRVTCVGSWSEIVALLSMPVASA